MYNMNTIHNCEHLSELTKLRSATKSLKEMESVSNEQDKSLDSSIDSDNEKQVQYS